MRRISIHKWLENDHYKEFMWAVNAKRYVVQGALTKKIF